MVRKSMNLRKNITKTINLNLNFMITEMTIKYFYPKFLWTLKN